MEQKDPLALAPTREEAAARGRVCPKCSYARRPVESAPAWQCPRCGIVYDKYLTGAQAERAAERAADRHRKPEVEVADGTRRWPWVLAALAIAAGGYGAWQWQAKRSRPAPDAQARLAQIGQAQQDEQMWIELKAAGERSINHDRAFEILKKYANQGQPRAMTLLGIHYGRPNHAARMEWLHKAANEGDAAAFVNLGFIYQRGEVERRQVELAANWYGKAARQGDATGLSALGHLLARGDEGIARNPQQAYLLLELAERAANAPEARRALIGMPYEMSHSSAILSKRKLEEELSPVDAVKARELADAWKPGQPLPVMQ